MIEYPSLIEIGLKDYLKQRGNGNIYQENHMLKIDYFVKRLPDDQKEKLKNKINKKKKETHTQHNDVFHELSIACAFYGSGVNFLEEAKTKTPDFRSNGIYVEVKTINNSGPELKRQHELGKGPYCSISSVLTQEKVERIKELGIEGLCKKFTKHINKAKSQLEPAGGHIWIVCAIDSPPTFHNKINKEIENEFDKIIKNLQNTKFCIRYIFFESLRKKIVEPATPVVNK